MNLFPWVIVAITVAIVFYLDRWENRYIKSIFDWVPAILLAYLIPAAISFVFGVDYSQDVIHNASRDFFIPLAIISVMASLSLGQLKSVGLKPIILFVGGSAFIALFPVLYFLGFSNSDMVGQTMVLNGFWKGLPPIVGSWIGGSTSQLVLKELVECPEEIFLSVLVMDNILVNIWTVLMFQAIKKSGTLNRLLKISDNELPSEIRISEGKLISSVFTMLLLLAVVVIFNHLLESFVAKVVVLSLVGLAFGNFIPKWNYIFSLKAGALLILVVMAVLGLKLRFDTLGFNMVFFGFLVIWLFWPLCVYGILG